MAQMYLLVISFIIGTVYSVERITFATWNTQIGAALTKPRDLAKKLPAVDVYVFQEVVDESSISALKAKMPTDNGNKEWDYKGAKDTPSTDNTRNYKMYVLFNKKRVTWQGDGPKEATWTQKRRRNGNVKHYLLPTTPHIEFDVQGADGIYYKVISVHLKATIKSDIDEDTKEARTRLTNAKTKRKGQGDELVAWYKKRYEIFVKLSKKGDGKENEELQKAYLAARKLVILGDFNGL